MAAQVFAFILHKDGKADDSAFELLTAARALFPDTPPIALVAGQGTALDAVCTDVAAVYPEVWKFAGESLAYPNAETLRVLLAQALPRGCVLLLPHTTLGMDLGPGLAVFIRQWLTGEGAEKAREVLAPLSLYRNFGKKEKLK